MYKIGDGNFSEIFKGKLKYDQKWYAIKFINKSQMKKLRKEADVIMEKHCLERLAKSPFVINL